MKIDLKIETKNPSVLDMKIQSVHKSDDKIIAVWQIEHKDSPYQQKLSLTSHCYVFGIDDNLPVVNYVIGMQDDIKCDTDIVKISDVSEIADVLKNAAPVYINGTGSTVNRVSGTSVNDGFLSNFSGLFPSLRWFGGNNASDAPQQAENITRNHSPG